jgi:hypothetical protein
MYSSLNTSPRRGGPQRNSLRPPPDRLQAGNHERTLLTSIALTERSFAVSDIFLSYSSADRDRVAPIATALERLGWIVWWDRRILAGQSWDDVIAKALDGARCIVVVWTEASVNSDWVRIEANIGREREILAPILLDDVPIPLTFRYIHFASLVGWEGTPNSVQFAFLADRIEGILSQSGHPFPQAPVSEPITVSEGRALDAAMARELPIHLPASLIAMLRFRGP